MQPVTPVDTVAPVSPAPNPAVDAAPLMHVTGTLRQRNAGYLIEERMDAESRPGTSWTTPRVFRVESTDETHAALLANIDRPVTISGSANDGGWRHRTSIVLTDVQPLGR